MKCKFSLSWIGDCNKEDCAEHVGLVCDGCGAPAIGDCGHTMGPMTCGMNICNDCEHDPDRPMALAHRKMVSA